MCDWRLEGNSVILVDVGLRVYSLGLRINRDGYFSRSECRVDDGNGGRDIVFRCYDVIRVVVFGNDLGKRRGRRSFRIDFRFVMVKGAWN